VKQHQFSKSTNCLFEDLGFDSNGYALIRAGPSRCGAQCKT